MAPAFYPDEREEICARLIGNGVTGEHLSVPSDKGHGSFLLEPGLYTDAIRSAQA